jgi:serine/threonine-protein kinase HipA
MTLNGKRDDFTLADFRAVARTALLPRGRERALLAQVAAAVARWPEFAAAADVPPARATLIAHHHRLDLTPRA